MKTHTTVDLVLIVLALIAFLAAAFGVTTPRVNLVAAGLFLVTLTLLV